MLLMNLIDAIFEFLHKVMRKRIFNDEITLFIELLKLFFGYQMLKMVFIKQFAPPYLIQVTKSIDP